MGENAEPEIAKVNAFSLVKHRTEQVAFMHLPTEALSWHTMHRRPSRNTTTNPGNMRLKICSYRAL